MNFKLIESTLNISLPDFYIKAIENYPFKAVDKLDFIEDDLVRDTDWIIENNTQLRSSKFFNQEWPLHYFAFAHDGFGNYMFLNLKDDDKTIYFADHEEELGLSNLSNLEYSSSMAEYIAMSIEDQKEIIGGS